MSSKLLTPSLVLGSALVLGAAIPHAQQARLIRVAPRVQQQAAAPFDASDWSKRLSTDDLAQRERAYGELADLARRNDAARNWVREQAQDDGELAWTCRLLQRELDHPFAGLRGALRPHDGWWNHGFDFQPFDPSGDPFATRADLDALRERMQKMFDDMQGRFGQWPHAQPGLPGQPALPKLPGVQSSSRTLQMETGPDGCKVTVEEEIDGKLEKRTYEAQSLDELLETHPELRDKIGVTVVRPHAFGAPLDFSNPRAFDSFGRWMHRDGALRTDILGVVVVGVSDDRAEELGLADDQGLLVQRTEPGTIASVLGLAAGDVLAEINGRTIRTSEDIGEVMRARGAGDEVSVTWYDASGRKRTRTWREGEGSKKSDGAKPLNAPKQDV